MDKFNKKLNKIKQLRKNLKKRKSVQKAKI